MTKYKFTSADVVKEVKKLAKERPDFNYKNQEGYKKNGCSYVAATIGSDKGEGCIVGQALSRLGVSRDDLVEQDSYISEGVTAGSALENLIYDTTEAKDVVFLNAVQKAQDSGFTWSEAVKVAKNVK